MECASARERIHRRIDGELDDADSRALDAHLEGCPACRRDLDELLAVTRLVAVVGRTDREARPTAVRSRRRIRGLVAAAILLAAATVFALVSRRGPEDQVSPGDGSIPPAVAVADADFEVTGDAAESLWVVRLPSRQPDVHLFWLYADEH